MSEEFLSEVLRLVDELCDVINSRDPDVERTVKVNQNLNEAVSCYRNNVLIDSKFHAIAETKKEGNFLKDFLPHSQNEEFESYNADNYNTSKESVGKKTHICAYCEKYFTDKSNLSRH